LSAIFEVLIRQSYYNQEVLNRFHYVSNDVVPIPTAAVLAQSIGANSLTAGAFDAASLMGKLQALQTVGLSYLEVQVRNLYSNTDFFTVAYNPAPVGVVATSQQMSPAVAFGVVSNRVTLAIRRGHKRFCGVDEAAVDAGGVISSGGLTALGNVCTVMTADSVVTIGLDTYTYHPAVLHFQEYTTPRGNKAYKPWPTLAEQLDHAAVSVTWSPMSTIRTQRSRQYGRGA